MEPISALPGCVLQMTLKSSCSQTALPRLSLRSNSEEWDCCGSDLAVCWRRGEQMKGRGKEERNGGGQREHGFLWSLSLTFQSLFPNSSLFVPCFLANILPGCSDCFSLAPGAVVCFTVIGSFSLSPTPQQHQHHLHIHLLPNLSVIQALLIDIAPVYLAWALTT